MPIDRHCRSRTSPHSARVLIVEDHSLLREGIKMALGSEPAYEIVGEVGNGLDVYRACAALHPDVVLLDLGLPGINGLDVISLVKRRWPRLIIVVLTAQNGEARAREALAAGANGYILKAGSAQMLRCALREVLSGARFIDPTLDRRSVETPTARPGSLTARERQVLQLVAQGARNRSIAEKLCISIKTVETHRLNLMRKLDAHSAVELTNWAHRFDVLLADATS